MEYNKQKEEILKLDGNILVQASAGSGKTTLLIDEAKKLYNQGKKNLLILTFSNNAVKEIQERLSLEIDTSTFKISTIHSFCFSIIKDNLILTGFEKEPRVVSEKENAEILVKIFKNLLGSLDTFTTNQVIIDSLVSFLDNYSLNSTKEQLLLSLYNEIESNSTIEECCEKTLKNYSGSSSVFVLETVSLLCDLLKKAKELFAEYKLRNNFIDFNDMEKITLNILQGEISKKYRAMFDYVLVDEYQDTSAFQEKIISLLSDNNLFCVGDLKQSIYGFRAALPEILKNRQESYSDESNGYSRFLTSNYRSSKNIIDFTNDLFNEHKDASGFFSKSSQLIYAREHKEKDIEPIELITCSQELDKKSSQINEIIKIIKDKLGKPFFDSKNNVVRNAEYNDFLILFRNLNPYKEQLLDTFKKEGVPFSINQSTNLLNEPEIKTFISILKAVCYHTDIDIINIFHKGILGLDDKVLCEIKNASFNSGLYQIISTSDDNRLKGIKELLTTDYRGFLLSDLDSIIKLTNFRSWLENYEVKEVSLENFDNFIFECCNLTLENEDWQLLDLVDYLDYLNDNKIKIKAPDLIFDNSVILSTIHGSKGSERPFVIIAASDSTFSFSSPPISFDRELGLGIKYYNIEKSEYSSTPQKNEIDEKLKQNYTEEELRLLYVAITRAREKLYIIGDFEKTYKNVNSFCSFIKKSLEENGHESKISFKQA